MRLTTKVAVSGSQYMTRFPMLPCSIEELKDDKGGLDFGKVRAAFRDCEDFIQVSSGDDNRTFAIMVEFLRQMKLVSEHLSEDTGSNTRMKAEKPVDKSLERKMAKEQFGYVRFDVGPIGNTIRVRVDYSNPKGIVGNVEKNCRRFAVYAARILNYIRREMIEVLDLKLVGRGAAEDIFEEAAWLDKKQREWDRVDELNALREKCTRRINGYCSPSDPECKCYMNGKCCEQKVADWALVKSWDEAQRNKE